MNGLWPGTWFSELWLSAEIPPLPGQRLQQYSYAIVEAIKVIGGTNIQFAHDPKTGPGGGY